MKSILISGASLAGPALAFFLKKQGFSVTVVEQSAAPRQGGQAIDIRGVALDVCAKMGLLHEIQTLRTQTAGISMHDAEGNEVSRSEELTLSGGRFDNSDVEILRDDLSNLLVRETKADVEYLYGDSIVSLEDGSDGVAVTFRNHPPRTFDLVIGADGLYSKVRRLAFGDDTPFMHPIGMCITAFTTPNMLGLDNWQYAYWEGQARYIVYPVRNNSELRVLLMFTAQPGDDERIGMAAQKALVMERCGGLKWEMPRIFEAMHDAPDFYSGAMALVRMDRWSRGRIALLGDAGYSPSPFSGQGTSLALVGAYILAAELGRTPDDHEAAFNRYEARMRPYVALNQALALRGHDEPLDDDILDVAKNGIAIDDPSPAISA